MMMMLKIFKRKENKPKRIMASKIKVLMKGGKCKEK